MELHLNVIHNSWEVQVTAWSSKANMTRDHLQEMQRRPLSPRCKNLINMVMIFFHWDHHKECIKMNDINGKYISECSQHDYGW